MTGISKHLRASAAACFLVLAAGVSGAGAGTITGFGSPSDAIPGGTVVDFESVSTGNYASLTVGDLTLSGTGGSFSVTAALGGDYNTTGASVNSPPEYPDFRFDFAAAVSAFAFNMGAHDVTWTLSAFDSSDALIDSLAIAAIHGSDLGEYYGITGANISYATLSSGSVDYVLIDNVTFSAAAVPEPGALALLGLGLAGLGVARRRQA